MKLIFATSDKGGTGRSVTSCNIVYRRALLGKNVCYLDFDFGSPTAGAIFNARSAPAGVLGVGLHAYLHEGTVTTPHRVDVWDDSEQLNGKPSGAGRLILVPGDIGGGEFPTRGDIVDRCIDLFVKLYQEFDLCVVDLSAGRSHATEIVLRATAHERMRHIESRWLVFHRWTRQHIDAANSLAFGKRGIVRMGEQAGHRESDIKNAIRFVRTAVVSLDTREAELLPAPQLTWLRNFSRTLERRAAELNVGGGKTIGSIPLDPILQFKEQLITDRDTQALRIANTGTVDAFRALARELDNLGWSKDQ
jgi:hypothetical protein